MKKLIYNSVRNYILINIASKHDNSITFQFEGVGHLIK